MAFPGTWMNLQESLVYRVIPKCACSTIGQILYYGDNGRFFDGDIHDATSGIHKWNMDTSQKVIEERAVDPDVFTFTCVRNPYSRILSAFFDKIAGTQRNGKRYRGNLVPLLVRKYGVDVEGDFDQVASFRRFLLFVRDTIRFRRPMDPDIHWSSVAGHASTLVQNGGAYDAIIATESFKEEMKSVLDQVTLPHKLDLDELPRFNESSGHGPKRTFPVAAYFDDLAQHLMWEIYHRDFKLFQYDPEPGDGPPKAEIDLDEVRAKLAD
jgi:hypothetical protein